MSKEIILSSKNRYRLALFLVSIGVSLILYLKFFLNLLPIYFGGMESINKNVVAYIFVLVTVYILLKMVFGLYNKWDGIILFSLYIVVLTLGLLRPDGSIGVESHINLNPMQLISDLQTNSVSWLILYINIILFMPMYFLLTFIPVLNSFLKRVLAFEIIIFIFEGLQAVLHVGIFDIADIMLYNIGFFIGAGIVIFFNKILKIKTKRR